MGFVKPVLIPYPPLVLQIIRVFAEQFEEVDLLDFFKKLGWRNNKETGNAEASCFL